jgi:uncharacterized protein DUF3618
VAKTDPDEIQREIERTRTDLAETIDAIAQKVSPRRALTRTVDRVRAAVQGDHAGPRVGVGVGVPETGERVGLVAGGGAAVDAPTTAIDRHEAHARDTGAPGGAHAGSLYTVQRRLRVDRVLIAAGAAVALVIAVVLVRHSGDDVGDLDDFDF